METVKIALEEVFESIKELKRDLSWIAQKTEQPKDSLEQLIIFSQKVSRVHDMITRFIEESKDSDYVLDKEDGYFLLSVSDFFSESGRNIQWVKVMADNSIDKKTFLREAVVFENKAPFGKIPTSKDISFRILSGEYKGILHEKNIKYFLKKMREKPINDSHPLYLTFTGKNEAEIVNDLAWEFMKKNFFTLVNRLNEFVN